MHTLDGSNCCVLPDTRSLQSGRGEAHLRVSKLHSRKALVGFFHTCHIILTRAVLRMCPVQGILVTRQDGVEIRG